MQQVADGVHRLGARLVNWFIVEEGGRLILVDAGNPRQYRQLPRALAAMGKTIGDVEAVLLTHAHGDHLGASRKIQDRGGAAIRVHHGDAALARGEAEREYERHYVRDLGHLHAWKALPFFLFGGATMAKPVAELATFDDGERLDLPGSPRVIHTPGHTDGSACLVMEGRRVLFTGDALVTLNISTGAEGPRIMPGAFNKDSPRSLESLSSLQELEVDMVLPGHGEPWAGSAAEAVRLALETGPA